MFKLLVTMGFAALLASCSTTNPILDKVATTSVFAKIDSAHSTDEFLLNVFEFADIIIVDDGTGGHLDGMIETLYYLDENPNKIVVIDGACASACTLLLSRPKNVVFTENAVFRFHSASIRETRNGEIVEFMSERGNTKMLRFFTPQVQKWIEQTGAFQSLELTDMDSDQARRFYPEMFIRSDDLPDLEDAGDLIVSSTREFRRFD